MSVSKKYMDLFHQDFNPDPNDIHRFSNYYMTLMDKIGVKTSTYKLKYISLFSGIGGFEVAIHSIFPNAECVGFSEIKKSALNVYKTHFPDHLNLGCVKDITKEQIQNLVKEKGCDLIVGGFPCTNLSSIARITKTDSGLDGPKSGLFYYMKEIIQYVTEINPNLDLMIENNASMSKHWKGVITTDIQSITRKEVLITHCDGKSFGPQRRRRVFWTTFNVNIDDIKVDIFLDDILDKSVNTTVSSKCIRNRLNGFRLKDKGNYTCQKIIEHNGYVSFTTETYEHKHNRVKDMVNFNESLHSKPILTGCQSHVICIKDTDIENKYILRTYTKKEIERLFMFPHGYTCEKRNFGDLYGNSVIVSVIQGIVGNLVN